MNAAAPARVRAVPASPAYVRARASRLVADGGKVLLLRAEPVWRDEATWTEDGQTVRVVEGISQLAVLDAYATWPQDVLVVLTDRTRDDLGEAVWLRAAGRDVERVDEWTAVPEMFAGAHEVDSELARLDWAATALLDHRPTDGWPASPTTSLTAPFALGCLISHTLGMPPDGVLDGAAIMAQLSARGSDAAAAWRRLDPSLQRQLAEWAVDAGRDIAFALRVASSERAVGPVAVALVADVLWQEHSGPSFPDLEAQFRARERLGDFVAGSALTAADARVAARTARAALSRLTLTDAAAADAQHVEAQALFGDVRWPEGATHSSMLRAGLDARLRELARALASGSLADVESALADVERHALVRTKDEILDTVLMAVRVRRWLDSPEQPAGTLADALGQQIDDGAWIDRAASKLYRASDDPAVSDAYGALLGRVREHRRTRDQVAASMLTAERVPGVLGVEDLLHDVAEPWTAGRRKALLIVLDGMSATQATSIAGEVAAMGLDEWVPSEGTRAGRRLAALAVLPTMTGYSRTSLLCGALRPGGQAEEKAGFSKVRRGVALHKEDLRPEPGAAISERARTEIASDRPIVAAVINTIDDTLHKQDVSAMRWSLEERLRDVAALVNHAVLAGRAVILTSDHGHVIEHDTDKVKEVGVDGRWRPVDGDLMASMVREGEVHLAGSRILAPGGEAVMVWDEGLRYGRRAPGYHGGASLAETTVPVTVFHRHGEVGPPNWTLSVTQEPSWW